MRILLSSLLATMVMLSGSPVLADDYQSPMAKAQYTYLKSLAWTLSRESALRFCGQNEAADELKPTNEDQLPSVMEAGKVFVAEGGRLSKPSDTVLLTTVLANSETPMDMGFRLGIGAALDLLVISDEKFCEALIARIFAEIEAAPEPSE